MTTQELSRATERMIGLVGRWPLARWRAPAPPAGTRADLVHGLVQRIADRAADAEGQPRRAVPRLEHDNALPDQIRVVVADLLAAAAPAELLAAASEDLDAVRLALVRSEEPA